jgi:hypothetical protein
MTDEGGAAKKVGSEIPVGLPLRCWMQ